MECVIREVKDFKPYINRKTIASIVSLLIAFYFDYIPFLMGASVLGWIGCYCLLYLYSYVILNAVIYFLTSASKRQSRVNFKFYLMDKGYDVDSISKGMVLFINLFTRKVYYSIKDSNSHRQVYCFDIKKNILILQDKNKNM